MKYLSNTGVRNLERQFHDPTSLTSSFPKSNKFPKKYQQVPWALGRRKIAFCIGETGREARGEREGIIVEMVRAHWGEQAAGSERMSRQFRTGEPCTGVPVVCISSDDAA